MPGCLSGSERLCHNNKQPQPLSALTQQTVSFLFTPKGHLELVWDCLSCPHSRTQADGVATIWRVAGFCALVPQRPPVSAQQNQGDWFGCGGPSVHPRRTGPGSKEEEAGQPQLHHAFSEEPAVSQGTSGQTVVVTQPPG